MEWGLTPLSSASSTNRCMASGPRRRWRRHDQSQLIEAQVIG